MIHHRHNKQSEICPLLQTGSLLIATPFNIKKTNSKVTLLITHHSEAGSTGIILNRDLPGETVLKYFDDKNPVELKYGGPNHAQCESYIVIYPSIKNGWKDSVYWSTDVKDLKTILHFMSDYNIRYGAYYGCLRWGPDELENEIAKGMWWLTNEYPVHSLFDTGKTAWHNLVKRFGGFYSGIVDGELAVHYN